MLFHAKLALRSVCDITPELLGKLGVYDFTLADELPVPEQFRAELDGAPGLADYTLTAGMVNGRKASLNVDGTLLKDGVTSALEAWPLTLEKQDGVWKIPLETLRRLMGL